VLDLAKAESAKDGGFDGSGCGEGDCENFKNERIKIKLC